MNMKLITTVFALLLPINLMANKSYIGIGNEAKELKDQGNYLEAAQKYKEYRSSLWGKELLDVLYPEGECYYMLDDYEQLNNVVNLYTRHFWYNYDNLGDSLDVYRAYLHKMMGNLYYHECTNLDSESPQYENNLYSKMDDAYNHYIRSLNIFAKRGSDENANAIRMELAQLFYWFGCYSQASSYLTKNLDFYHKRIENYVFSDEENYYNTLSLIAICDARIASIEEDDSVALFLFKESISKINDAIKHGVSKKEKYYYNWLRLKGKILMMQYDRLDIDEREEARKCYEQYINYQRITVGSLLSQMTESQQQQNWLALHDFLYDCYRLGDIASEMLYDLALFSKNYLLENHNAKEAKWQDIKKALKNKECAVEFVQYKGAYDQTMLGCLVVRKDSKVPKFVNIAATDSLLEEKVKGKMNVRTAMTFQPEKYNDFIVKDWLYRDTLFFNKIWTPQLMEIIGDAEKVYFSPDGFLHQLAIEYMMPDTLKDCYRLSSTRVLLRRDQKITTEKMLLMGDMDYYTEINPTTKDNDVIAYNYFEGKKSVGELPFAKAEVDSIVESRKGMKDTVLTGKDATDENLLKMLQGHYPIIHISTHGFFLGEMKSGTDLKPTTYDRTMSRSGIIFAGLISTLTNKNFDKTLFDGILSAGEFAKFDMNSVELATLSACQTGLGEITSDGVFGMQRGLKQAGVKSMMISLWSVNNYSSSVFYKHFYQALSQQEEKSFHKAMKTARKKMIGNIKVFDDIDLQTLESYKHIMDFGTPHHTHPYILIDAF